MTNPPPPARTDFTETLARAARAALRARGHAEPNPTVGCVIIARNGDTVTAHHRAFGGPHAEANALALARARHIDTRGATAVVTLEPCNHTGKQPPCAPALADAGISTVVFARHDPSPLAAGGAAHLASLGINTIHDPSSNLARYTSEPFVRRVRASRPWVIAKWAQTLDGKLASRSNDSKWISNQHARRDVHRLRARVDAVLTTVATVRADDPLLTARGVHLRRTAQRVVVDPELETPPDSNLARSIDTAPLTLACTADAIDRYPQRASALSDAGARLLPIVTTPDGIDLEELFNTLWVTDNLATVLVEAGPRFTGTLLNANLVDEARVYVAPRVSGDPAAHAVTLPSPTDRIADTLPLTLLHTKRLGDDIRAIYAAHRDTEQPSS